MDMDAGLNYVTEHELTARRVSEDIVPRNYDLKVVIPSDSVAVFTCEETIDVTVCCEEVSTLVLHGYGLKITSLRYKDDDTGWQPCAQWRYYDADEIVEISFNKALMPGDISISIHFKGRIRDDLTGLFRFRPRDANQLNKAQYNFATQLEPAFARRVFFCWDEPGVKATFRVSLVIPRNWIGLSNMGVVDVAADVENHDLAVITFDRTPLMSAYLLAFVVGSFHCVEACTPDDRFVCRVYTPTGRRELGTFALKWAMRSMSFFTNYFNTKCPLLKLDIASVPEFTSGSMENWGLLILKENYLLIDEDASTFFTKQWATLVLSHEISLQWLGNMVAMGFSDLWFKESMASFLEYSCADSLNPKADLWLHFAVNICGKALPMDSMEGGSPISVQNGCGSDEKSGYIHKFSTLSLLKGVCLLHMFSSFVTDETFRNAVRSYANANSSTHSTRSLDFWHTLEESGFDDATNVARSWTSQSGFPLIKIAQWKQLKEARMLVLTQEKFCANPRFNEDKRALKAFQWSIPMEFVTGKEPKKAVKAVLMRSNILEVSLPGVTKGEWIKIRSVGYFRVHYPPSLMRDLLMAIKSKQMPPLDRIGLLDDLFHLCKCGEVATTEVLQALKSYRAETNYYVWQTVSTVLKSLHTLLQFTSLHEKFEKFGLSILRKAHQRIGFDGTTKEGPLEEEFRTTILLRLIELNDKGIIEEGVRRFQKCLDSNIFSQVPAYLRPVLYGAVVVDGSVELFRELLNMYETSASPEERTQILRACGYARTKEALDLLFEYILSESARPDAVCTLLYSLCSSRFGIERVWDFFRSNVGFFEARFSDCKTFHTLVGRMIENFCDGEVATEVENFFRTNCLQGLDQIVKQGVEGIRTREAWLARDAAEVEEYLDKETTNLIIID